MLLMTCRKRPTKCAFTANAARLAKRQLLFLRLNLAVKRRHANPEHGCGFFARAATMCQGGLDITALLLLNEIVQWFAHRHRGPYLLGFFTQRGGDDVRRQIRRQDHVVLAQSPGALDRVLQFTHVAWIIVMAKDIDGFWIDSLCLTGGGWGLLLQKMVH